MKQMMRVVVKGMVIYSDLTSVFNNLKEKNVWSKSLMKFPENSDMISISLANMDDKKAKEYVS